MSRVLVIEDEELVRNNIAQELTFEGFNIITAEDGDVGVQYAKEYLPDLIICDVMMPKLDGYGVLQEIRHNPLTAKIPFILMSAKADTISIRQGITLGADDYLTKPFKPNVLLNTIVMLLKHD